ncbi:MAG TPA: SDR family oxidoreductase [Thermoanaerobaculia bacterium]|nr:SDR family oxidoreductase [Thermoanaerobaculia bacterium]
MQPIVQPIDRAEQYDEDDFHQPHRRRALRAVPGRAQRPAGDSDHSPELRLALGLGALGAVLVLARAVRRHRALDLEGRRALVTGGSRGLGLCIAEELARQGVQVAILARDPVELDAAAERIRAVGPEPLTIVADLRRPADSQRAVRAIVSVFGGLDLLVNNAGVITVGPLSEMTAEDFDEQMAVHFGGPLRLILAALPHLERSGQGRIVNIASFGGRVPVPHLAPYCASKAALIGLSDALRPELVPRGIKVTTVCPGLMRTGSHLHAQFKGNRRSEATWFTASAVAPLLTLDPREAAERIVEAARHGDPYLTFNFTASLATRVEGLMPGAVRRLVGVVARLLPRAPANGDGRLAMPGWRVGKSWLPPMLRRRSERAARRHLETVGVPSESPLRER